MDQDEASAVLGRQIPDTRWQALIEFVDLLLAANTQRNLTAVRDRDGIYRRHILESLALAALLERHGWPPSGGAVIDVGSGGGVPGIPLAVIWPDARVVLLDATARKTAFLADAIRVLGLGNAAVLTARAEEAGHLQQYRESASLVTARAVASLDTLAELTLPLVAIEGLVAAVKGSRLNEEIAVARAAIATCGGVIDEVVPLGAPAAEPLSAVLLRKTHPTPSTYPRRPGMPAKRPLR